MVGIKVGDDVDLQSDIQLQLSSKYPNLKAYKWGDAVFTLDGSGNAIVEILHGLGYAPAFVVFRHLGNNFYPIHGDDSIFAFSDSSKLTIQVIDGASKLGAAGTLRYYIFIDKIQEFTGSGFYGILPKSGIKVANLGFDAQTAEEYNLAWSSRYKSLQYFSESIKEAQISLPLNRASLENQDQIASTYVDFTHGFDYPPFFLAWAIVSGSSLREIPFSDYDNVVDTIPFSFIYSSVSAFCDSSKIRVTFQTESIFDTDESVWAAAGETPAATLTIRVLPFTESLISRASE